MTCDVCDRAIAWPCLVLLPVDRDGGQSVESIVCCGVRCLRRATPRISSDGVIWRARTEVFG